jgi:lipid A ethanolaminephosphotransferase
VAQFGQDAGLVLALGLLVMGIHVMLLTLVGISVLLKPLLGLLTVAAAAATHFTASYGVVLDPGMMRNVLATHPAEAQELFTLSLASDVILKGLLPAALVLRWPLRPQGWRRDLTHRMGLVTATALACLALVWLAYQPLASLVRNHHDLRYLITPANVLWSGALAMRNDVRRASAPRQPIGLDARAGPSWKARQRPLVVVLVVGETARAANWGLNEGARDTTPELRQLPVVNFSRVVSCGTNTEVSLPCMFAPVGRRDYDESKIRGQESLLHVLNRAGVQVHWLDNQSGCKGVCDGLPFAQTGTLRAEGCADSGCHDDALLHGLADLLKHAQGTHLRVLHMIGNHGPAYYRRYPTALEHFKPACKDDNLHKCNLESVVNAYDNALRFTDHVLAQAIDVLNAASDRVDTALIYVSDHGESLGEKGLFLHGLPYRIAPEVQIRVPMVWWLSPGLDASVGLTDRCAEAALRKAAQNEVSHDHLFHSVIGLLDVRTALYEPRLDLLAACRSLSY